MQIKPSRIWKFLETVEPHSRCLTVLVDKNDHQELRLAVSP